MNEKNQCGLQKKWKLQVEQKQLNDTSLAILIGSKLSGKYIEMTFKWPWSNQAGVWYHQFNELFNLDITKVRLIQTKSYPKRMFANFDRIAKIQHAKYNI